MEKNRSCAVVIGVTGHRPNRLEITEAETYRQCCETLTIAKHILAGAPLGAASALAEGADQIFAQAALDERCIVEAILPFSSSDYETTFSDPVATHNYRTLLAECHVKRSLDGDLDNAVEAYVAVGQAIVETSDILFAVWDGGEAAGRGGTTDTIHLALSRGLPVIWIDASGRNPRRQLVALPRCATRVSQTDTRYLGPKQLEQLVKTALQARSM